MKAAIVTIGDEILIGQIVDTNSAYIAKALDKIGIRVHEMLSISDDKQHILNTLQYVQNQFEIVIITGGLGPTKDDITKKTFCDYFQDTLILDPKVLAHVTQLIEDYFKRPITQANKDQALVPATAQVLFNTVGTAPGIWMQKEATIFISLPGVPYEMKYLLDAEVIPQLVTKFKRPYILHKTLVTYGVGESLLAERIEQWEDNLPSNIKLAYLPSPGKVRLRLTARGDDQANIQTALDQQVELLIPQIKDCLIGLQEEDTLEVVLGKLLNQNQLTIATAESCTGGKIATMLTEKAGASTYFKGSVVSYATQSKIDVLGVAATTINNYNVVSAQVAQEMAQQAQKIFKTDYAIATTGNAGPSQGDVSAPVGTVYIGIATPSGVFANKYELGQPREKVIDRAVNIALELIYKEMIKKE